MSYESRSAGAHRSVIAVVAGTDPSAVAIDNVQYQVTVDLTQNPSGERRRLLADGYSVLLVGAPVAAPPCKTVALTACHPKTGSQRQHMQRWSVAVL